MEIWAVEGVAHTILFYLDLSSFDAVLNVVQDSQELHEYLHDSSLWTQLSKMHFGGKRDEVLQVDDGLLQDRNWEWTSRECTCIELQEFLQSMDDRKRFKEAVIIVEGDIQRVDNIDGTPLDGIAFPTSSALMNPHIGAAGAVFRRAGRGLDEFVSSRSFRDTLPNGSSWLPAGSAIVTPAFKAGVDKLIHCVGPSVGVANCYQLLGETYENAMGTIQREELQSVAMVSVSTGNLGVPCVKGAHVALRVIQKFLARGNWRGKLAVVCSDNHVLQAFKDEKTTILGEFNLVPELPDSTSEDRWFSW